MVTGIIIAAVLVGGVGLFIGLFLGIAGKKFAVEVDEKEILVREAAAVIQAVTVWQQLSPKGKLL